MYGSAHEHGAARYVGNGKSRWTCVHVDDLAHLYLLEQAPAASIFNGAHGAAIPVIDIARHPLQVRVMHAAADAPNLASAMNIGAFNLGNVIAAVLGGGVIAAGVGYPAVAMAGAAASVLGLVGDRERTQGCQAESYSTARDGAGCN